MNKSPSYYISEKSRMLPLIPDGPNRILDLGCATGRLGTRLRKLNKGEVIVGVELFKPAAAEAALSYDVVHQGDVEILNLPYHEYFDIVICGDILEHLKDPWQMMDRIFTWLKKDGMVIISIPNIRYWRILKDIIVHGNWEYTEAGILDNTHLRFFTRNSFIRLLEKAKFDILSHEMIIYGPKQNLCNKLSLSVFEEFMGSQIMITARKRT